MQPVTVADAADELYGLSPAEFTAARDELSRQARAAGQRDDAAAIKKLAKPTVSAWLVNQLARNAPDQIARLTDVGDALQEAQRTLDGDRLRELSAERRQVVNDLLPAARRLSRQAGQPASAGVLDEVRATLEAALADAGARDAVRSGRLTRALAYAGLGEVDLSAALAVPASGAPAASRGKPRAAAAEPEPAERPAAAERAAGGPQRRPAATTAATVLAAEAEAAEAAGALATAERKLAGATEQRQFLRRRIDGLKEQLDQAIAEDAQLSRDVRQAQRERDAAARAEAGANLRLDRARQSGRRR